MANKGNNYLLRDSVTRFFAVRKMGLFRNLSFSGLLVLFVLQCFLSTPLISYDIMESSIHLITPDIVVCTFTVYFSEPVVWNPNEGAIC